MVQGYHLKENLKQIGKNAFPKINLKRAISVEEKGKQMKNDNLQMAMRDTKEIQKNSMKKEKVIIVIEEITINKRIQKQEVIMAMMMKMTMKC